MNATLTFLGAAGTVTGQTAIEQHAPAGCFHEVLRSKPAESLAETVRTEPGWVTSVAPDGVTVPLARNMTTSGLR